MCEQGSGLGGNWRGPSPVEYRGHMYMYTSICLCVQMSACPSLCSWRRRLSAFQGDWPGWETCIRIDVQVPPVFYRTLSPPVPSGAAAQKTNHGKKANEKKPANEGKMAASVSLSTFPVVALPFPFLLPVSPSSLVSKRKNHGFSSFFFFFCTLQTPSLKLLHSWRALSFWDTFFFLNCVSHAFVFARWRFDSHFCFSRLS